MQPGCRGVVRPIRQKNIRIRYCGAFGFGALLKGTSAVLGSSGVSKIYIFSNRIIRFPFGQSEVWKLLPLKMGLKEIHSFYVITSIMEMFWTFK